MRSLPFAGTLLVIAACTQAPVRLPAFSDGAPPPSNVGDGGGAEASPGDAATDVAEETTGEGGADGAMASDASGDAAGDGATDAPADGAGSEGGDAAPE